MENLYIHMNHRITLMIERSSFSIFANIDFRDSDPSEPNLKKYTDIYRRLLSELNFTPISKQPDLCSLFKKIKTLQLFTICPNLKKPWTNVSSKWRRNMFDFAVLPSDLEYCRTNIEHVCEFKTSCFRIIGKVVSLVRISNQKRAF